MQTLPALSARHGYAILAGHIHVNNPIVGGS